LGELSVSGVNGEELKKEERKKKNRNTGQVTLVKEMQGEGKKKL